MKVTHRLYFAFLPAAVGVITVAALGYWGQYARTVPELFLLVAIVATIGTVFMSWLNVRYVATRVERLSHWRQGTLDVATPARSRTAIAGSFDELDAIEGVVTNLADEVASANTQRDDQARAHQERMARSANLLADVSTAAIRKIDEIRLPLHILLENHFGDLNENQEEMLEAARAAAESANRELVMIGQIAELELGRRVARQDRVYLADLWHAILPMLETDAKAAGMTLHADIPPLIPPIVGDATQIREAFLLLVREAITDGTSGGELHVSLTMDSGSVQVVLRARTKAEAAIRTMLADRLIGVNGSTVARSGDRLTMTFPA